MKISEIIQSNLESTISRIGNGPYLYSNIDGQIFIDCDLNRILKNFMQDGKIVYDIEIYAYRFKKDENDNHQYINANELEQRFEEMAKNDTYEYIEPMEQNGIVYQVPSYCGFDELLYFAENGMDITVNCKPVTDVINEEYQRRLEISDAIRR